jgi:anti-sigma regulatory factor (Ser/Thr protein kinase)
MTSSGQPDGQSDGHPPGQRRDATGSHRTLLYQERGEYTRVIGAFMREGLASDERILVTAPAERLGWIVSELGPDAPEVEYADAAEFYRSRGHGTRATIEWLRSNAADGQRARVVAEQALALRPEPEVADYLRAEAAANVIYRPFPVSILCPYDAPALPESVLLHAQRTHPEVLRDNHVDASPLFIDPREFVRQYSAVVMPPPPAAASFGIGGFGDLGPARRFLHDQAAAAGLGGEATDYLLIAVGELVTNALVHGRPPRRLWVYADDSMLICHISDSGPGPADPLAAYLVPEPRAPRGHGLWLASQLGDRLELASDQASTHARLGMALPACRASEPGRTAAG